MIRYSNKNLFLLNSRFVVNTSNLKKKYDNGVFIRSKESSAIISSYGMNQAISAST